MRYYDKPSKDPYRYWWQRLYGRDTGFSDQGEYIRGLLGGLLDPGLSPYGMGDTVDPADGRFHVPGPMDHGLLGRQFRPSGPDVPYYY
jgi:hypothetical protein